MEDDEGVVKRRRPRWRMVLLGLVFLLLLLFAILWSQRRQIAADYIDAELERRGVPATYTVKRIGFTREQIENLVIGDPARPDLTARFVEVKIRHTLLGPKVSKVTARGVRLYGRIVEGKLNLGSVDRLLPPPSGKPFSLPDLDMDVADAAVGIDTPIGSFGIAVEGKGNLSDGFDGKAAATSRSLLVSGCAVDRPTAYFNVAINDRRPSVAGPVRAARVFCEKDDAEVIQPVVIVDTDFAEDVRDWHGKGAFRAARARLGANAMSGVVAELGFDGDGNRTAGRLTLAAVSGEVVGTTLGRTTFGGRYSYGAKDNRLALVGDAGAEGIRGGEATVGPVVAALSAADGTPLDPIGDAIARGLGLAARSTNATTHVTLVNGRSGGAVRVQELSAVSRSGARAGLTGGSGLTYYWPAGRSRVDGNFTLSGGGLPSVRATLAQSAPGAPISGVAQVAPMAAGGASLRVAPIRFSAAPGGGTSIDTVAVMDGPFSGGQVRGLSIPISGRLAGGGFAFGERCTNVTFQSLQASGLQLGPSRLPLCPTGRALVWRAPGGSVQGGAELRAPRLAGRLGSSPITMAADRIRFGVGEPGFTGSNLAFRLGPAGSATRLDFANLAGRFAGGGITGTFSGGEGKLANIALLVKNAKGGWTFRDGKLAVDSSLTVVDETDPARFHPLVSNDFRLTLADGVIEAGGWMNDPETGTQVTDVDITHTLATGAGRAILDVPGITFGPEFQPDEITPLTTGVVALVDGKITGRGEIAWTEGGSSSTGSFTTHDMDLAATFGPVEGLNTTINFTDLLNLVTAPGQVAEVDLIRSGIDVFDGLIRYQLLPDLQVRVESGTWPFAGGTLMLEETLLDFSRPAPKKLTFRVVGLDAASFVQLMEFTNITATGTFDGVIPMIFDERGGRIVGGRLAARPEGGTLSYIGELTDKELGAYGKLAFDALKSLRYNKLDITLDGALDGEFLTQIELDGLATNTSPLGGIMGAVVGQLAKIPFEFNISVRGPFRALLATARSLEDPSLLIQPVLPEVLQDLPVETTVQPEESETVQ